MKLSSILCASIVTLAAIAMSAVCTTPANAAAATGFIKATAKNYGLTTGPDTGHNTAKPCLAPDGQPIPNRFQPNCAEFQATTVNSSRSNIKNNLGILDKCPNGEASPCPAGKQGDARVNSELDNVSGDPATPASH
ncbi:MAG: hypothetical protein ABSC92_07780 [Rhizomicrobium sp.]|jgi:hypothetical protein